MKSFLGLILLSLAAHAAAPEDSVKAFAPKKDSAQAIAARPVFGPPAPIILSQEDRGKELCWALMSGDSAILASYFEDSVKANLKKETISHLEARITWLSKLIGDSLEQLTTGTHRDSTGRLTLFFREYRLANESNKRAPLLVIHVLYKDSTTILSSGVFVKSFLENSEKRIASDSVWKVNGKKVEVNSVALVQLSQGSIFAVKVYDDDTATLDSAAVKRKGVPIIREAIARGYLEKAKAQLQGKTLLDGAGIAFIRTDPHLGYVQLKYGLAPQDYETKKDSLERVKAKKKTASAASKKAAQAAP